MYRILLLLMVISFVFQGFSQVENNKPTPSTNSIQFNTVPAEDEKQDTLHSIEEMKVIKKSTSNKKKEKTSESTVSKNSNATVQQKSLEFSNVKQQVSTQRTQKTPTATQQRQMDATVNYLEEAAPESFEYNFYKYLSGNYNTELFSFLEKAYLLQPNNTDVQMQMAAYYWITNNTSKSLSFLKQLISSGKIAPESVAYAKNLLLSVPANGTLITHGNEDSYATIYLQLNEKMRSDVTIISLDFLQSDSYIKALKDKGYILPDQQKVDVSYLDLFCQKNEAKKIGVSLTVPKEYLQVIQTKLYVVGLVFEYHSLEENNFYKNEYLWGSVMDKKIILGSASEKSKALSANYLLMLLQMREVYLQKNNLQKVEELDKDIDKIAQLSKKTEQVQKIKKKQ